MNIDHARLISDASYEAPVAALRAAINTIISDEIDEIVWVADITTWDATARATRFAVDDAVANFDEVVIS